MDSNTGEIAYDFSPLLRIYKDGRIERIMGTDIVPPALDPNTDVESKDIIYSSESNLSARLFLPKSTSSNQKLPLLVYFHGGGFVIETPFSSNYHNYLNKLVAEANIIAVSVDYRRAPEHPVPIGFDDSWTALKWVASHIDGNGPDEWLNSHADFGKVFLAGDSAGAAIAHQMAIRNGQEKVAGITITGLVLIHPYFWGEEPVGSEAEKLEGRATAGRLWLFACPTTSGCDDPLINPVADPKLGGLGCSRVLICVAGKDLLKDRGYYYFDNLKKSGWEGKVEVMESEDEEHVFYFVKPSCENAVALLQKIVSFFNQD